MTFVLKEGRFCVVLNFCLAHDSTDHGAYVGAFKFNIDWLSNLFFKKKSFEKLSKSRGMLSTMNRTVGSSSHADCQLSSSTEANEI